jgi:mRNA interferase YafQ
VPIPAQFHGHALTGDWAGKRDCHIKPDLVLIYEKPHDKTLRLISLDSHAGVLGLSAMTTQAKRTL